MEKQYNCCVAVLDNLNIKSVDVGETSHTLKVRITEGSNRNTVMLDRNSVLNLRDDLNQYLKDTEIKINKEYVFGASLIKAEHKIDEIVKQMNVKERIISRTRDRVETNQRIIKILAIYPSSVVGLRADKIYIDSSINSHAFDKVVYPLIFTSKEHNKGKLEVSFY